MTCNELLLAMSDMLDTKLRAELRPLRNEMQDMKSELQGEMQDMKSELQNEMLSMKSELQGEMQDMKSGLQGEMQDMKSELQGEMQDMKSELQGVIRNMQSEIHQIKLCQENMILPQLETIESCYVDTYHRYRNNADRMDAVFEDVDIMKKVITEHSKTLQKLA